MSETINSIIEANASAVRKVQFCQQVKVTQATPSQIAQVQQRYAQSVTQLKAKILLPATVTDLGEDYDTVKAVVDSL